MAGFKLRNNLKKYFKGTQRICSPAKTKRDVLESIKKAKLPIFCKIVRIDNLDCLGIPVFAAIHSNIFSNWTKPSWGKGLTEDAAYVSAAMERVERYSASDINSIQDVVEKRFIDFNEGEAVSRWDLIPCNLQRNLYTKNKVDRQKLLWTKCFSLTDNKDIFVPANAVYFFSSEKFNDLSYTTGLASGNSIEEAILHALCEVIERHAEEVAYRNKIKFPTISLETIKNKEVRSLVDVFLRNGFNLYLNRLDDDFNVSIIRAFAFEKKGPYINSYAQYACTGVHPNKEVAIIRALTEIAQLRACHYYQIKNKIEKASSATAEFPEDMMRYFSDIVDHEHIISLEDIKNTDRKDISLEIKGILNALKKKDCEVILKDLTHPVLKIPVVRVIVKGLQPGNHGVHINELTHRTASISEHLNQYEKILKDVKKMDYLGMPKENSYEIKLKNDLDDLIFSKLERQYNEKRDILKKTDFLKIISKKGELGIVGIDGKKYPFPKWEKIKKVMENNHNFFQRKILQGFDEMDIVPFALPLATFLDKVEKIIIKHYAEEKLFGAKKNEQDKNENLIPLELNKEEALWFWRGYKNADTSGKLLYDPQDFSREKYQGHTKREILDSMRRSLFAGYFVTLNEKNANIPARGMGKIVQGRKQLEAGYSAKQYLEMLQKRNEYFGEKCQNPEEWLTRFVFFLEKTNQVIDDYQSWGKASYQIGAFFPETSVVPYVRWSRLYKQAQLDQCSPIIRDVNMGTHFVVRIA